MQFHLLLAVLLGCVVGSFCSHLPVVLLASPSDYGTQIKFTVSNPTQEAFTFLTFNTPFDFGMSSVFRVYDRDGIEVPYVGPLARRVFPPSNESLITVQPGDSLDAFYNLAEFHSFQLDGEYVVAFHGCHFVLDGAVSLGSANPIIARISTADVHTSRRIRNELVGAGIKYTNCVGNEPSQVKAAVDGAIPRTLAAKNYMTNYPSGTALTVTWFGTFNSNLYNYDRNTVFTAIHNHMVKTDFVAYCNPKGCSANTFAYVYPTDTTFTVYLCGAFWSVPKERVATIVHEMSHFKSLGATDDYAYGQANCKNLAKSNPTNAAHNADNVCYFADEV